MASDHDCPAPGCTRSLPGYLLACNAHWFALPPDLRRRITRAWQDRRRHPTPETIGAHLELVVEAMEVWAA